MWLTSYINIPLPRRLALCEMQTALSSIWTQVTIFISFDNNNFTTSAITLHASTYKCQEELASHSWLWRQFWSGRNKMNLVADFKNTSSNQVSFWKSFIKLFHLVCTKIYKIRLSWVKMLFSKNLRINLLWELYKNATCCFEQILVAASYKTVTVRPPASHLINHPSQIRHTGHSWRSKDELLTSSYGLLHMKTSVLSNQQRLTSVLCGHQMHTRRPVKSDEW